jgi:predicted DNA-binding transcriptional regulator YafY
VLRGIYGVDEKHFTTGGLDTAPAIHLGPVTFTAVELTIFVAAVALMLVPELGAPRDDARTRIRAVAATASRRRCWASISSARSPPRSSSRRRSAAPPAC